MMKEIGEEEEDIRTIYIPEIDVSIHGTFVGLSPAGIPHRKFVLYLKYYESDVFKKIVDTFVNSGWSVSFDQLLTTLGNYGIFLLRRIL